MTGFWILWLVACPRRGLEPMEVPDEQPEVSVDLAEQPAAFRVVNGPWTDRETGLSIDVLEGWSGQPGTVDSELRIRLEHASSGASLEIRALEPAGLVPRERTGCTWEFSDEGGYSSLRVTEPVRVSSCVPNDPGAPRVFATMTQHGGWDWHFDLLVPQGYLAAAKASADSLLATVRFGS
ncbi:MAG: hypothetical protein VX519_12535 [Myxococcota bacterium]|nr:hypothetical protein [Myxococcota bacterium]